MRSDTHPALLLLSSCPAHCLCLECQGSSLKCRQMSETMGLTRPCHLMLLAVSASAQACPALRMNPGAMLQVIGHDDFGRPIFYSNFALATSKVVEENRRHMIATFEQVRILLAQAVQVQ